MPYLPNEGRQGKAPDAETRPETPLKALPRRGAKALRPAPISVYDYKPDPDVILRALFKNGEVSREPGTGTLVRAADR